MPGAEMREEDGSLGTGAKDCEGGEEGRRVGKHDACDF